MMPLRWKDLVTRFHLTNLPRSYQLTQQILSLQQGASDLSSYYTKLKTLWDDLDGADHVKTCQTCTCCKATSTKSEHTKVIKFLAGLNESYSNARSQIIMKKHVLDLSEVYNLLDQEFNQRTLLLFRMPVRFMLQALRPSMLQLMLLTLRSFQDLYVHIVVTMDTRLISVTKFMDILRPSSIRNPLRVINHATQ